MRSAVELWDRNDVGVHLRQIGDGIVYGGLAAGDAERFDAPLQQGNAPLQHSVRRIADSGVAVSVRLEVEQRGTVVGAVEGVGGRLIYRYGYGLGGRLDLVAAVDSQGFGSHTRRPFGPPIADHVGISLAHRAPRMLTIFNGWSAGNREGRARRSATWQ